MPSKPWLENACPTQNYNVRTAELQLVQVLAAILTAVAANQSSSRRDRDWPWGSRLAHRRNSQGLETINALHQVPPGPVAAGRHTACGDGSHYCVSAERWRR